MKTNRLQGVLVLGHCATRNGAPIGLLHFLRWVKKNSDRQFSLLLDDDGPLTREYAVLADTWCARNGRWGPGRVRERVMLAIGLDRLSRLIHQHDLRRFSMRCAPGLIYLNSFAESNFWIAEALDLKVPILTHVHETGFLVYTQGGSATPRILSKTEHFIACSNAVKENLINRHSVQPNRIDVVHESIAVADTRAQRTRSEVLRELGFPEDAFIVAGCGMGGAWNKGMDLFLQLAHQLCRKRNSVCFVWVGAGYPSAQQLQHDANMLGIAEKVRFTGLVDRPADYLSTADAFALTSREDSFPLACLEAAALGKPIVCFANAGGMPEFVEDDCGYIVPYLDIGAMADRIIQLVDCPACREKMSAAARRKVAARHDISVAAPRILEIIEKTIHHGTS